MSDLHFYFHPFSLFSQKVLIALYEKGVAFVPRKLESDDPETLKEFGEAWPIGRFPVLRDEARSIILPESSIIIEHLDLHHSRGARMISKDADLALQIRLWDRIFDLYVAQQVLKIVSDRARSPDAKDGEGVKEARAMLAKAYELIDRQTGERIWATGEDFSLADCAAAPALFYAHWVQPFGEEQVGLKAYFDRLLERPSFARIVEEAKPYRHLFPAEN